MRQRLNELVIVPGHALFRDEVETVPDDLHDDRHWELMDYQAGEPPLLIAHMKRGIKILRERKRAALVFSGGRTRPSANQWSEASTAAAIAAHHNYWADDPDPDIDSRVLVERYARDSQENLALSLELFRRFVGSHPLKLTVVGWGFKAERFKLHARHLGIPDDAFDYEGENEPYNLAAAQAGEERALQDFRDDPFAQHPPLSTKREARNLHGDMSPYRMVYLRKAS